MKKILDIALLKVRITLKDRGALIMMLLAPLAFVFIFTQGFASSKDGDVKYPITIVNQDNQYYGNKFEELIKKDSTFQIYDKDYEAAKSSVKDGKSVLGIVIPKGFSDKVASEKDVTLETLKLQEDGNTTVLSTIVENYLQQVKMGAAASNSALEALRASNKLASSNTEAIKSTIQTSYFDSIKLSGTGYKSSAVKSDKDNSQLLSTTALGLLIMFIMFFVTRGANSIMEEKETGTWSRISSTPTKGYSIMGGFILGNFILGWIQVALLMLISKNFFNISWGNSLPALILLFSCFIAAVVGFGIALTSFVKNKTQLSSLSTIIVMPTSLIAGCMWPRDIMPDIMIKISNFVPQTWALSGMKDLLARSAGIDTVVMPSLILLLFTLFFFTIGIIGTARKN